VKASRLDALSCAAEGLLTQHPLPSLGTLGIITPSFCLLAAFSFCASRGSLGGEGLVGSTVLGNKNATVHMRPSSALTQYSNAGRPTKYTSTEELKRIGETTTTFLCMGVMRPYSVMTDKWSQICVETMQSVARNRWLIDITDAFLAVGGNRQSLNSDKISTLSLPAKYSNTFRSEGKGKKFIILCPNEKTDCDAKPLSGDEVDSALVREYRLPTLNKNRGLVSNRGTAAIMGYFAATIAPADYIDGWGKTIPEAANEIQKDTSYAILKGRIKKCLSNVGDDTLESCVRMGLRLGIIDQANR